MSSGSSTESNDAAISAVSFLIAATSSLLSTKRCNGLLPGASAAGSCSVMSSMNHLSPLVEERIADLQEEGAVGLRDVNFVLAKPRVVVAGEQHGLGVELVGEEELSEDVLLVDRAAVEVLVLEHGAHEGADVELVDDPALGDVHVEEAVALGFELLAHVLELEVQPLGQPELDGGVEDHRRAEAPGEEVDLVAETAEGREAHPPGGVDAELDDLPVV